MYLSAVSYNVLTNKQAACPNGRGPGGFTFCRRRWWVEVWALFAKHTCAHTLRGDVMRCQAPQSSAACAMSGRRNDLWILGEQSTNVRWALCPCTTWINGRKSFSPLSMCLLSSWTISLPNQVKAGAKPRLRLESRWLDWPQAYTVKSEYYFYAYIF